MPSGGLRGLVVPGLAALAAFAILCMLGAWQLDRKAWKEGLIAQIEARAHRQAGEPVAETDWRAWQASDDEFRRVRVTGSWVPDGLVPVIGIAEERPGRALQGVYVFEPVRRDDGTTVVVNRGFVPIEAKDQTLARLKTETGRADLTGLVRAPERPGWFIPANDPARSQWFTRDTPAMAAAAGLVRAAPFYVDADASPRQERWPRGGGTPLTLRNPHLEYALTWFGLAAALVGVFATFAAKRLRRRSGDELQPHDA